MYHIRLQSTYIQNATNLNENPLNKASTSFADDLFKIRGIYGFPPDPSDGWCTVNKGN